MSKILPSSNKLNVFSIQCKEERGRDFKTVKYEVNIMVSILKQKQNSLFNTMPAINPLNSKGGNTQTLQTK